MTRSDAFSSDPFDDGRLSDAQWRDYLQGLDFPHLNEWMREQASRGQNYYLARLDRIGFRGGRALDAGCGAGNWAIALARRFQSVEAIDTDPVRLGILTGMSDRLGNIGTTLASVLEVPFPDNAFDNVFCNGVVFLTDTRRALSELARVLKPGGQLYVSYTGPGWWRHLIADRGPTEPACYLFGANGLTNWAFRLAEEACAGIADSARAGDGAPSEAHAAPDAILSACLARLDGMALSPRARRAVLDLKAVASDLSIPQIDPRYRARIGADLSARLRTGAPDHAIEDSTHTYRPEEMSALLAELGLDCIHSAAEGCLALEPTAPWAAPIYREAQGVYESVARRPPVQGHRN